MNTQTFQPSLSTQALPPVDPGTEGGLNLGDIVSTLKRRALLIVGITAAVAAAAGVRAYLSPPSYSGTFEFLIQPQSAESEVVASDGGDPLVAQQANLSLEDQIRILTSPGVLKPLIDEVRAQELEGCVPPNSETSTDAAEANLQRQCYSKIQGRLVVTGSKGSNIVSSSYTSETPENAEIISNLAAQTFLDYGLASRQRDIQQGLDFLDDKIPDLRAEVGQKESEIQNLQQAYNFLSPDTKGGQISGQIGSFENKYLELLIEMQQKLDLYDSLRQELARTPGDAAVSPALGDSSRYQKIIGDLLALDNQIAETSSLFTDSSPDVQSLYDQRANLLALLAREGENAERELLSQIEVLASQEAALSSTLEDLNLDIDEIANVTRQFTNLGRELDIVSGNLGKLLDRRATLQIELAQRQLPWELITPTSVSKEIPSLGNSLAVGAILGLLLGSGLALALDTQKDVLYTAKDLKRVTPVPILGVIPFNSAVERGYTEEYLLSLYPPISSNGNSAEGARLGRSPDNNLVPLDGINALKEAFRSLVANLQRAGGANPLKSLVISSVDNEVADSSTAAYLAWAAAEMGSRVLLIDADFRFPHLHKFLELPNEKGLGNILSGELDLKHVIKRSPVEPNLFVLTAGSSDVDPARLMSSGKIRQFVAKTEAYFDLIIYDAPPFSDYADAALLSAEASGLVLVSQLGTVKSAQLEQTLEKLWISKIPLIGLIAKEAANKMVLLPIG
ncbi:MAG: GumC family protein [Nodosilinea sp.]